MSFESFVRLLQEIITMNDPNDREAVARAEAALAALIGLALYSGKIDGTTRWAMLRANGEARSYLFTRRGQAEFAGRPGDYAGNQAKRNRLAQLLCAHC